VARHYGKSYATIQGWASALRNQGYRIGRSRKS
jgi:transposase